MVNGIDNVIVVMSDIVEMLACYKIIDTVEEKS